MKKHKLIWIMLGAVAVLLVIGAASVQPGRPISQYPRVTTLQGTDIFPIARTNVTPATNMGATWIVITNDIFTMVSNYVSGATNGFSSIPLNYQTNAWTTNIAGTPVIGASSLSVSNAGTNWAFFGTGTNTVARIQDILGVSNQVVSVAESITNHILVPGTNIVITSNLVGNVYTWTVSIGTNVDLSAYATTNYVNSINLRSNFVNLSVQAAKLNNSTNTPIVSGAFQIWELLWLKTNNVGTIDASAYATWQFTVPWDYATNSLKVYLLSTLVSTNGAGASNSIFAVSILKATPGDSTDTHVGAFGAEVFGTNTWSASTTGTNKVQSLLIDLGTNSLLASGDLAVLKLRRNCTNDTHGGTIAVVGLQLPYGR